MLTLTIRTDKPEAEVGLFENQTKLAYSSWPAHRRLAETIHYKIKELLDSQGRSLEQIDAIGVFKGPGSFTGLRIGLTVANTLADSLKIPIISETGNNWLEKVDTRLEKSENEIIALPEYGSSPRTTKPRK